MNNFQKIKSIITALVMSIAGYPLSFAPYSYEFRPTSGDSAEMRETFSKLG